MRLWDSVGLGGPVVEWKLGKPVFKSLWLRGGFTRSSRRCKVEAVWDKLTWGETVGQRLSMRARIGTLCPRCVTVPETQPASYTVDVMKLKAECFIVP